MSGFNTIVDSDFRKFCLHVNIKCKTSEKKVFRVWAEELGVRNTRYADRRTHKDICQNGQVSIYLSFPVSPKKLFIGVLNESNPADKDFEVTLIEAPLQTYNIDIDGKVKRFVAMALKFSQACGHEQAMDYGRPFRSEMGEFTLKYFPTIRDRMTNAEMNTPARIGHESGIIEVAKCRFDKYTIPMRMIILLHEFSHKWRNPEIGLEISNEKGADINALYIYLGLGFSKIDCLVVFANVFYRAATPSNRDRLALIYDYCQRFKNQEFAELN